MNNRLQYFDVLKGIAIFLVVMGHVLTMCIRDIDSAFSFKLIGEIHMPIFFFISGYFSYKTAEHKNFIQPKLKQRFLQLIIPFLVVSALWIWYFPHSGLHSPLKANFSDFWLDTSKNGYWFTLCLFEIIVIYALTCFVLQKVGSTILQTLTIIAVWGIIGILTFIVIPEDICAIMCLVPVFQFFPIFMGGILARKHQNKFLNVISNNKCYTICLLIAIPTLYYTCYYWEFYNIPIQCIYFIKTIFQIVFIAVAINIVKSWQEKISRPNFAINTLSYLGKQSLAIYLLHYFLLFPMSYMQEPLRSMGLGFLPTITVAAIVATLIIVFVLILNHIIGRSKLLSLLLTGKIN